MLTASSGRSAKVGTCGGSFLRCFFPAKGGVGGLRISMRSWTNDGGMISSSLSGGELRGESVSDMAGDALLWVSDLLCCRVLCGVWVWQAMDSRSDRYAKSYRAI